MKVNGIHYEAIWLKEDDPRVLCVIDQEKLPFRFVVKELRSVEETADAIRNMTVRGAPLIGAAAAFGLYLAVLHSRPESWKETMALSAAMLKATRPTAVNLAWALERSLNAAEGAGSKTEAVEELLNTALEITEGETENCRLIGENGLPLIEELHRTLRRPVNILTHCNAGWLACIDYGTALSPVYAAHDRGIPVHVWVDETRPLNQGARLTAWELGAHGVPHTVIADNTGGHLMQHGQVDLVLVGSDRTTLNGDVANKIGTYLKALAAKDNGIPFYVALPSSSIDFTLSGGLKEIPIEERSGDEVRYILGEPVNGGEPQLVNLLPPNTPAVNYAFDVTPARLVSGLITERGICGADREAIRTLFPF
ncbi:MAG: S-methyl-5-thioribose-1-phosphate isomerase [Bacteroidota bacterium]